MEIQALSKDYRVTRLRGEDIPRVLRLCEGNPQYYRCCPPAVCAEGIRADMAALPPGTSPENKYFLGFWERTELVAVMDLILKYPDSDTAFLGFFMVDAGHSGRGVARKSLGRRSPA